MILMTLWDAILTSYIFGQPRCPLHKNHLLIQQLPFI